jgi:hypothetical protein
MLLYVLAILLRSNASGGCPAFCVFTEHQPMQPFHRIVIFAIWADVCIVCWIYPTTCLFVFPLWYKYYHLFMWKLPGPFFAGMGRSGASVTKVRPSRMRLNRGIQVIADIYRGTFFLLKRLQSFARLYYGAFVSLFLFLTA